MNGARSEDQIRAAAEEILTQTQGGAVRPTVTALAKRLGITRPTLYRNHPDLISDFITRAEAQRTTRQARPTSPAVAAQNARIARLRRENEHLRLHVDLYEEHLRRLTTENSQLRERLEQLATPPSLEERRQRPQNP